MKNISQFGLFIIILGAFSWFGLPWWFIAVVSFFGATIFHSTPMKDFGVAYAAGTMLWGGIATWQNYQNGNHFAPKIGEIFQGLTILQLTMATSVIGGLLAGMGALSGGYFRELFLDEKIIE
jgi:hypothetical protein